jgi:hypothetical protein
MPNALGPFLEMRGGCGCARVYDFPKKNRSHPLAREEERLAHIAELACGRSEAEDKAKERHDRCAWGWLLRSA